jgi:hypothetical protein
MIFMAISPTENVLIQLLLIVLVFLGLGAVLALLGWLMMPSLTTKEPLPPDDPPTPLTHTTEAIDDRSTE